MTRLITGIPIDAVDMDGAIACLNRFLLEDRCHMVFTPNAEILMEAWRTSWFREILKSADLCVADGAGVVLAGKILKTPLPGKVPGVDLADRFMAHAGDRFMAHAPDNALSLYLLGARPGIAEEAALNLKRRYPWIRIVGTRDGFFNELEEPDVVSAIAAAAPDLLLVALGKMKQESFIFRNREYLNARICMGVGGSLDVYAGKARLAPAFFRDHGLEWLYRLLRQPKRLIRMLDLPRFAFLVLRIRLGLRKSVGPSHHDP
ncbi:MAG TPA: glycosyltransferase [Clostridiales bacterium]|nr:glycosyltransferase [Clostridiales bacterium]